MPAGTLSCGNPTRGRRRRPRPRTRSRCSGTSFAGPWKHVHFVRYKPSGRTTGVRVPQATASACIRGETTRPDYSVQGPAVVRSLQPHRAGRRQSRPRRISPDHELRRRLRTHRDLSDQGRSKKPPPRAHAVPVARGDCAPALCPRRADPRGQPPAGRHHPPASADRVPQERDHGSALVRGSR